MQEVELKFQVSAPAVGAVRRALATRSGRTITLHAIYFDTADRRLARAGIALRLRREGRRWVQTLKCSAGQPIERTEHDALLGMSRLPPALDVARHAGSHGAEALAQALGPEMADLQPVFETRVRRLWRVIRKGPAAIEVALDEGKIVAAGREIPLREVEFELLRGPVEALVAVAQQWVRRHGLWLDVRSKAERGDRLARDVQAGPVVGARAPWLAEEMTPAQALCAMVDSALAQILPNAADVAAGVGTPGHLHQLRVGLRRLRSALRLYGDAADPRLPRWEDALARLFTQLGASRDRDVMRATVQPLLRAAGAPWCELPPAAAQEDPGAALRGVDSVALLLELIAFAQAPAPSADAAAAEVPLSATLVAPLRRLHERLRSDAEGFLQLDDASRHRTRKRAKRLRYGLEFASALLQEKRVRRYLQRLRTVQEALGEHNDLCVAEQIFRDQVDGEPRAWFAVGWLQSRRTERLPAAAAALSRLDKFPQPARARRRQRGGG